jgi:hypothetical protein
MLGKLRHTLLDDLSEMTLPVHIIRTRGRVLELQWTIFILRVLLHRLEKNQRIA